MIRRRSRSRACARTCVRTQDTYARLLATNDHVSGQFARALARRSAPLLEPPPHHRRSRVHHVRASRASIELPTYEPTVTSCDCAESAGVRAHEKLGGTALGRGLPLIIQLAVAVLAGSTGTCSFRSQARRCLLATIRPCKRLFLFFSFLIMHQGKTLPTSSGSPLLPSRN